MKSLKMLMMLTVVMVSWVYAVEQNTDKLVAKLAVVLQSVAQQCATVSREELDQQMNNLWDEEECRTKSTPKQVLAALEIVNINGKNAIDLAKETDCLLCKDVLFRHEYLRKDAIFLIEQHNAGDMSSAEINSNPQLRQALRNFHEKNGNA
jgi:hypothetical protein